MEDFRTLLREFVAATLAERKRQKRRKPGGPRTYLGALMQVNPDAAKTRVRSAVKSTKGDVPDAAEKLDVSSRTLYHYLDNVPTLGGIKTTADIEAEEEARERAAEKRKKDKEAKDKEEKDD